jgi:OFA family oxalate/formate antiporter-like MFS transporter
MTMIANLQYGWTLFVNPIAAKFGWEHSAIQWAFTIFVLTETWLIPFLGYLEDLFGPRPLVLFGGMMVAIAWVMNSYADSLNMFYAAQAIGGIGAGAVYGTCVGNALKWFPDRRGLAAGLTAAGFGIGSALTIIPISKVIAGGSFEAAFLYFGLLQGFVVIIASFLLRTPPRASSPRDPASPRRCARSRRSRCLDRRFSGSCT